MSTSAPGRPRPARRRGDAAAAAGLPRPARRLAGRAPRTNSTPSTPQIIDLRTAGGTHRRTWPWPSPCGRRRRPARTCCCPPGTPAGSASRNCERLSALIWGRLDTAGAGLAAAAVDVGVAARGRTAVRRARRPAAHPAQHRPQRRAAADPAARPARPAGTHPRPGRSWSRPTLAPAASAKLAALAGPHTTTSPTSASRGGDIGGLLGALEIDAAQARARPDRRRRPAPGGPRPARAGPGAARRGHSPRAGRPHAGRPGGRRGLADPGRRAARAWPASVRCRTPARPSSATSTARRGGRRSCNQAQAGLAGEPRRTGRGSVAAAPRCRRRPRPSARPANPRLAEPRPV